MTVAIPTKQVTVAEYLREEWHSPVKREFVGGEVYAIPGISNRHNQIATNITIALGARLRGNPCRPFNSDTKVRIELANHTRFFYPDAMVVWHRNRDDEQWQDRPS